MKERGRFGVDIPVHISQHEFLDTVFGVALPEGAKDGDPATAA